MSTSDASPLGVSGLIDASQSICHVTEIQGWQRRVDDVTTDPSLQPVRTVDMQGWAIRAQKGLPVPRLLQLLLQSATMPACPGLDG